MKRFLCLVALPLLAGACAPSLRVMTFNVRYAADTPPHAWPARRPVMVSLLRHARPDVIGTQELLRRQGDDLVAALPGYRWFGRDREGGHDDEHMGILYRTDRLRLVTQGDFWLSDTPDRPGSRSWGTDLARMANWGIFETRGAHPRRFLFLDTHLAHRDQDEAARERSARLILDRLPALAGDLPVIVAGDFNADPTSGTYAVMAAALTDGWVGAARRRGPAETFHDFTGRATKRIDYLFVRGFRPKTVSTDTTHRDAIYPSDHFPVAATLDFPR